MKRYVLDTSALVTYISEEDGIETVESLITEAIKRKIEIHISVVSCVEVYYIANKRRGEKLAQECLDFLYDLPIEVSALDLEYVDIAGRIKANNTMAFADCCIAALAKKLNAVLVHKDPEYEQLLNEITQIQLPYKKLRKKKSVKPKEC